MWVITIFQSRIFHFLLLPKYTRIFQKLIKPFISFLNLCNINLSPLNSVGGIVSVGVVVSVDGVGSVGSWVRGWRGWHG